MKIIGESLFPETYQLTTEWKILPSEKKEKLSGYASGKHGTAILLPGALAKVAAKSLKTAQETLLLETGAEIGNGAKASQRGKSSALRLYLQGKARNSSSIYYLNQKNKLEKNIKTKENIQN